MAELLWWSKGWESTFQWRDTGSIPGWGTKIPHASGQLSLSVQFSSVPQSCPMLCDSTNHSMPGLPVHHQLPKSTQTHVHWVGDAIQPSHPLRCPLLLLPSIFPSITGFSNESVLRIRWPKYWSFSFNISPSNEHPGLISVLCNYWAHAIWSLCATREAQAL